MAKKRLALAISQNKPYSLLKRRHYFRIYICNFRSYINCNLIRCSCPAFMRVHTPAKNRDGEFLMVE